MDLWRKLALTCLGIFSLCGAHAEQSFRIATGSAAGTYHPVGEMLAKTLSRPGANQIQAQTSRGSVANLSALARGDVDSIFAQADIAAWAYQSAFMFSGMPRHLDLRLIANLYPETIHVVVRKDSGIRDVSELRGKRVSMDLPGSGTQATALLVLRAYGVLETDVRPEYIRVDTAADKLQDGELDAFFFVGGAPAKAIADLVAGPVGVNLLPIEGVAADLLRKENPFLTDFKVDSATYNGVSGVTTLAVGAQWLTSARVNANTVYELTKSLFSEANQKAIQAGHPKGKFITLQRASSASGVALHPGAERFYKEVGVLK